MKYSYEFFFNEEELCFYLEDKVTKIEKFFNEHKNDKNTTFKDKKYLIQIQNKIYPLISPAKVIFFFPDEKRKEIFIACYEHIRLILEKYNSYDFFYSKDENDNYIKFIIQEIALIYPVKKIKISIKEHKEIYNLNNEIINAYSELNPKNLSIAYKKYLKFSYNIKENSNFFNYTNERKSFFEYLDSKLTQNNIFIPICGPEGIGKTSSILAYCKMKIESYYFYYNVRTFSDLLKNNKKEEIKQLLIEELSHCCLFAKQLHYTIENILEYHSYNCNPIEFLINILSNIKILRVLIIDQYKTAFDEKYKYLKQLVKVYKSYMNNIILLSSMNEDDVKLSIIKGIKKEKMTDDNFFLEYLYISKLAYISEDYKNSLSEAEKDTLELFGNLYSIYYEIIEFKKKNEGKFNKITFNKKIKDDIKNNLIAYYKGDDKIKIYNSLKKLNNIELNNINKDEFIKICEIIPFRYLQLNINNNYMFKIDSINEKNIFTINYLYNYFTLIINEIRGEYSNIIDKDETLLENIKKTITPLKFEDYTFDYIWGSRKFDGIKLSHKIEVNSFFELNHDECLNIISLTNSIKEGEGFIISQKYQNAAFFDAYIFVKIKNNEFKLYMIQITINKSPGERLTLLFLNDFFGYTKAFLMEKCNINVEENYFCYIFDDNNKDLNTIDYCNEKGLDYLFYNKPENELKYPNKNLKKFKMKEKIFKNRTNNNLEETFEITKYYPKNLDLDTTKNFLKRKRVLMDNKNFKNVKELVDNFEIRKNYYNSIEKNFCNIKKIDNNDREEVINNFLVDSEFKKIDLVGIKLLIPNQNDIINQLKKLGLDDNIINYFFEIIGKDRNKYAISNIKILPACFPSSLIPEYMTYIIVIAEDKIIYQDYEHKFSYNLNNKSKYNFDKTTNEDWKFLSISLINKNLSKEEKADLFKITKK